MLGTRRDLHSLYQLGVVEVRRIDGDTAICVDADGDELEYPVDALGDVELTPQDREHIEREVRWAAESRAPQAFRLMGWLAARLETPDDQLPRLERELSEVFEEMAAVNDPFVAGELARFREAFAAVPPDEQLVWWNQHGGVWKDRDQSYRDVSAEALGPDATPEQIDAWNASLRALRDRIERSRHAGFADDLEGTAPIASNPALEAAIEENLDDDAAWSVYADWLQQQGDPRGELAALDPASAARLYAKHERYLLGGLPKYDEVVTYSWRRGWLASAQVATKRAHEEAGISQAALVATLMALPSARFLEELTLGAPSLHERGVPEAVIDALVAAGPRTTLRVLAFTSDRGEEMLSWTVTGPLERALPLYPNLAALDITAGYLSLGALELPKLARLRIETCGLSEDNLQSLAAARLPALTALELWFGKRDALDLAMAVVEAHARVPELGLVNTSFTDELAAALAASPSLPNRERLDLSRGTLTDRGALELARAHRDGRAPRLVAVDVRENYLTADGIAALHSTGLEVRSEDQRDLDGDRYCAVWE